MKRFTLIFALFLMVAFTRLSAQDVDPEIIQQNPDSVVVADSLVADQLAQMPIYNPKSNAAAQIYRPPKDMHYNMPIVGQRDTTESALNSLSDLGKDLPEQGPGDINKDQKADSTERK